MKILLPLLFVLFILNFQQQISAQNQAKTTSEILVELKSMQPQLNDFVLASQENNETYLLVFEKFKEALNQQCPSLPEKTFLQNDRILLRTWGAQQQEELKAYYELMNQLFHEINLK